MKMTPVEFIPAKRGKHDLQNFIEEFLNCDAEIVKIDFNEYDYKSASVCRSCIGTAITRSGHTTIKAVKRGDEVYMSKV